MQLVFCFGLLCCMVTGLSAHSATDLNNYLFYNYSRFVRPTVDYSVPVVISLMLTGDTIADLDEINQVFYLKGKFISTWTDGFLTWDPATYGGITQIYYPADLLWIPDFGLQNSADDFTKEIYKKENQVTIKNDGTMVYQFGGIFATSCSLDLTSYPYDSQSCSLVVQNWGYASDEVNLTISSTEILQGDFSENGLWSWDSSSVTEESFTVAGSTYPKITFTLEMTRKSAYYNVSVVAPCILLVLISLGTFWLPADAGEKIGMGTTVILAFSVYQIIIEGSTPATSDSTPVLTIFVIFVMSMSTISTLIAIAVLYFHHQGSETRVGGCARSLFLNFCARVLCMKEYVPDVSEVEEAGDQCREVISSRQEQNAEKPKGDALTEIRDDLRKIIKKMNENDLNDAVVAEWKALARIFDRVCFWVVFVVTVVGAVGVMVAH